MSIRKLMAFILALSPFAVFAHPGHGDTDGFTITHYFTEPAHAVFSLGVLVIAVVLIARYKRHRHR